MPYHINGREISELCIPLFSQVSVPVIILGSTELIRFPISTFLFLSPWKFTFKTLILENDRFDFLVVVVVWLAGEEPVMGGPRLLVMLETVESKVLKKLSVDSSSKDSNRLVEKFGIPHLSQCQDTLVSGVDICIQLT